jgi:hypothetical protein
MMTIAPLLSLAGIAAGPVAELAARAVESLDFSSFLGAAKTSPPPPEDASSAAGISLGDLVAPTKDALDRFRQLLAPRLRALGVDLSQPVLLAVDALGQVRETSGHPQGAQIEQLFASNDALSNNLREVSAQFEVMRAIEEHQRFAELYAQNPNLAIAQFGHLFDQDRSLPQFHLELLGDEMNPVFSN